MLKLTSTLLAALILFAGSAPLSVNAQTSEDDETAPKKSIEEKSFDIAERYFRRGKWRNAIDGYEKALPSYNQDSGIFYRLVVACSELGEARKTVLYGAGFNYLAPAHEFTDRLNTMIKKAKESLARSKVEPAVLTFEIAPKSTEITINYVPVGESFRDKIKLYPGTYTIRGTYYGHHEFKKVVEVTNRPIVLKAKLPKVITHGMLLIKTEPAAGITVYVDREKVGVTPLKPMKLRSGRHYIRFELEGFDRWHRYVEIENDGTHPLNPVMERTPPGKSPFRME